MEPTLRDQLRPIAAAGRLRVLFTSSRSWDDPEPIARGLDALASVARGLRVRLVVVHGACRKGGDRLMQQLVEERQRLRWPVSPERHPARWQQPCGTDKRCRGGLHRVPYRHGGGDYCPMAGNYRNEHMASLGADLCWGCWRDGSDGTRRCLAAAADAGIPPLTTHWEDRHESDVFGGKLLDTLRQGATDARLPR